MATPTAPDDGSAYDGDVGVGGPPQVRELGALRLTKVAVGAMDNDAYLLECTATGELCLVDAAAEPGTLLALLRDRPLARVVTTHRHRDHWDALEAVVAATGATVAAHPDDAGELPLPVTELLRDGDTLRVGQASLDVIHLVGHTPGSIALHYDAIAPGGDGWQHLLTGDSLFPGGPGNTFGDAAAFASLMADLEAKVFGRLPDDTWVYPGHGADTTLAAERPHLAEWRARGW